jgi:hypothetical protein
MEAKCGNFTRRNNEMENIPVIGVVEKALVEVVVEC